MIGPEPKPGILQIAHYVPGRARAAGFDKPVKLSANENALGSSPAAQEAFVAAAADLSLYPDGAATRLRSALSARFDLEPERLIFGCGSDELFTLACQAFLEPGDNIVQPAHGFAAWAIAAKACGADVRSAEERELTVDVETLLALVDSRTRLVFIANPANPTGTMISDAQVLRLLAGLPPQVILIYDGAYAEFAQGLEGYTDGLQLARRAPNLLVTRTFSKIYGLAALRVGWGYGAEPVISAMNRIRLPFNVSVPALCAAQAALADQDFVARSLAHVRAWLPVFASTLIDLGLRPTPSATNFTTFALPPDQPVGAGELDDWLAGNGLLVRRLGGYGLSDHLRVTVGADAANRRFLNLVTEAMHAG